MNRVNSLKDKVAELANRSVGYDKERVDGVHPIVLVDAVKSIIGLDLKRPNDKLLNWLDKDVLKYHSKNDILKQEEHKTVNASFKQLKEALLNSQKSKVDELLLNFNMLTDGTQLVEFFLEMSLYQSGLSFINIWRSFKIFKFIKLNDKLSFYKLLAHFLLSDDFRNDICLDSCDKDIQNINNNDFDIILFANFLDCSEMKFIRQNAIQIALSSMQWNILSKTQLNDSIAVSYDGNPQNRLEILNLVDSQVFTYSQTNILLLDSIRMSIKSNSKISSSFLDNIYSKLENHDL